jgi:hypothetical protein
MTDMTAMNTSANLMLIFIPIELLVGAAAADNLSGVAVLPRRWNNTSRLGKVGNVRGQVGNLNDGQLTSGILKFGNLNASQLNFGNAIAGNLTVGQLNFGNDSFGDCI